MLDFPASPTLGQQYTAAGVTWTWDGFKWTPAGLSQAYLPLSGGTLTGPLTLAADPASALQASTKQYVDGGRLGDNRILNGDMRIDQRNNGASGTATGYTVDRWYYSAAQANKGTWQRKTGPANFPYMLNFLSSSAYTPLAGDTFYFVQPIEADAISDFAWGTASAQPVTLSFWVGSSLTGTFSGAIFNYNTANRAYVFTFSIPTSNTWTKISITIPGDTGGTWALSGNSGGLSLSFNLGCGSTYTGTPGVWGPILLAATGSVNVVATNGAAFFVTGVKLEIGNIATPFNRQSLAKSLADCQRYYWQTLSSYTPVAYAGSGSLGYQFPVNNPVTMRTSPTVSSNFGTPTNCTAAIGAAEANRFILVLTSGATGTMACAYNAGNTISAEL